MAAVLVAVAAFGTFEAKYTAADAEAGERVLEVAGVVAS